MFDVAVIGNGVLGTSTALALLLREPTLRVCLVGPHHRPHAASAAAGAMLGCFGEVTRSLLASTPGRTKLGMAFEATKRWADWLEVVGSEGGDTEQTGTLVLANLRSPIERDNVDAIRRAAHELGARCEEVDAREVRSVDPNEPASRIALFLPGEGSIDARRHLANLERALARMPSFAWVDDTATSLTVAGDTIAGVTLERGSPLEAKRVLLAAGAASQVLLDTVPELARRIPRLFAGVGEALVLEHALDPFPHVIRSPNRAFSRGVHLVPRSRDCAYVGATNVIDEVASVTTAGTKAATLIDDIVESIHRGLASARVRSSSRGYRPLSADGWPLLGATSLTGLFVLGGTYRDGFHLSPLLAADMAERILGRAPVIDDHPFAPERRLIAIRSREDAIEETALHLSAEAIERARMPSDDALLDDFRLRARAIYDELGCASVPPVDFIGMLARDPGRMLPILGPYYRRFEAAWDLP